MIAALTLGLIPGCHQQSDNSVMPTDVSTPPSISAENNSTSTSPETLLDRRAGHQTQLTQQLRDTEPLPTPPNDLFALVKYDTEIGPMNALLSKPPNTTERHPAIIWVTGGFPASGIGPSAWEPSDPQNDQSAKVYREHGMVMMYPALRGCCDNPGVQEGFYGEVNDIISAGKFLQQQTYVDPERIFLGGHSTGGTLALLTAEATDMFRAVISFGPVEDPYFYGLDTCLHDPQSTKERLLRAPIDYLPMIRTPTIVIEGSAGNIQSLHALRRRSSNPRISFVDVAGLGHFAVLSPVNRVLAGKIMNLQPGQNLDLQKSEIQ